MSSSKLNRRRKQYQLSQALVTSPWASRSVSWEPHRRRPACQTSLMAFAPTQPTASFYRSCCQLRPCLTHSCPTPSPKHNQALSGQRPCQQHLRRPTPDVGPTAFCSPNFLKFWSTAYQLATHSKYQTQRRDRSQAPSAQPTQTRAYQERPTPPPSQHQNQNQLLLLRSACSSLATTVLSRALRNGGLRLVRFSLVQPWCHWRRFRAATPTTGCLALRTIRTLPFNVSRVNTTVALILTDDRRLRQHLLTNADAYATAVLSAPCTTA